MILKRHFKSKRQSIANPHIVNVQRRKMWKSSLALLAVCAILVHANPKRYHSVPTTQFEDGFNRISDRDMHASFDECTTCSQKSAKLSMGKALNPDELTTEYWMNNAKQFVEAQLAKTPNTKKAKNIIMFLGDGMSHPSIAATRVYLGGEELKLSFEEFPHTANSKTYCVDKQVADSACTATAYLGGVKTNDAMIGLNAHATLSNCFDGSDTAKHVDSIAVWAMNKGKEAGFVTTTRITHASPSGVFAHIADRDWENDAEVTASNCIATDIDDIAEQIVHGETAKRLKVIMGGGSRNMIDRSLTSHGIAGYRNDGKNLIEEWKSMNASRTYVSSKQELLDVNPDEVVQLLGIFNSNHIDYNLEVQARNLVDQPSLTDLTEKAIDILEQSAEGYFLFVEGGRIDHGHHDVFAKLAIDETAEFSRAITAALAKVNIEETLIVVTADHGHVLSIAGYAPRGNDIFGFAGTADDNLPYMTLSYANGLGYYVHTNQTHGGRVDASTLDRESNLFQFPATVPRDSETHGGEDVGIWAVGPWAHLFQGTVEQHVIPHIMAYASCIGNGLTMCDDIE